MSRRSVAHSSRRDAASRRWRLREANCDIRGVEKPNVGVDQRQAAIIVGPCQRDARVRARLRIEQVENPLRCRRAAATQDDAYCVTADEGRDLSEHGRWEAPDGGRRDRRRCATDSSAAARTPDGPLGPFHRYLP